MKEKLKILIANDDGIRSEGIAKLARAAASFGTVWVAAPEHQCSGMSVRLTISEKSQMAVYRYDFPVPVEAAWSVDGTPADCVTSTALMRVEPSSSPKAVSPFLIHAVIACTSIYLLPPYSCLTFKTIQIPETVFPHASSDSSCHSIPGQASGSPFPTPFAKPLK